MFMEMVLLFQRKKVFLGFFYHIWARKPSTHVTNNILIYFQFLLPKILHTKFGKKGQVVSVEKQF